MTPARLLLDAGNSSLKWAVVEDGRWSATGRADYTDDGFRAFLEGGVRRDMRCIIASVTRAEHERRLAAQLAAARLEATWLRTTATFGEVTNGYATPESLGVDRWMALIAARQRTREAVLVVSAGTAVTVDALTATGTFVGGLIVPGVRLMRQALQAGTARLDDVEGSWQAFPRRTADAVHSGIVAALCGAIEQQHARLAALAGAGPRCFLTGGDASLLAPHLTLAVDQVPELVLEGIERVTRGDDY